MVVFDRRKANTSARVNFSTSPSKRLGGSKALLAVCGVLALGLSAGLHVTPAQAQFRGFWAPDDDGYPPPIPPGAIGHRREAWAPPPYVEEEGPPPMEDERGPMERAPGMERMPASIAELRRRATLAGLKLLGTPHRRGDVFVAFGQDSHGAIHHLTFNAYEGRIVENEVSTTAKAAPAKPAAPAAAAVTPTKPNAPAAATATAAPAKPAATAKTTEPTKAAAPLKPAVPSKPTATTAATHSASPAQIAPSVTTPAKAAKNKDEPAPSVTADQEDLSPIRPKPGDHVKPSLPDSDIDKD